MKRKTSTESPEKSPQAVFVQDVFLSDRGCVKHEVIDTSS